MGPDEIRFRRLASHRLTGRRLSDPAEAVRALGAVQAQEFAPARWSLGIRCDGVTDAQVGEGFDAGRFVRTHVLRPTWHFVHPRDLRWMLRVSAPRVHRLNAPYYRRLELDEATLGRAVEVVEQALAGRRYRTRRQLGQVLEHSGIAAEGMRLAYIMMYAELEGVVCSGPLDGRQHTYALVAERVPATGPVSDEQALAELTRRFFAAHGPATAKDLRWWSSLTLSAIGEGLALVKGELESADVDGVTYWYADRPWEPPATPEVHLVQLYDEFVNYAESRAVLQHPAGPPIHSEVTTAHAVLLDGRLAGRWRVRHRSCAAHVSVELFGAGEDAASGLAAAVSGYGGFLGVEASWSLEPV